MVAASGALAVGGGGLPEQPKPAVVPQHTTAATPRAAPIRVTQETSELTP
jgi:hypothetical protein